MKNTHKFEPGSVYHVFNRTNARQRLFYNEGNCDYFLAQLKKYGDCVFELLGYCLLINHFHLSIKIKNEKLLRTLVKNKEEFDPNRLVNRQFRNFFISYSKALNKQQGRYGSLFQRPYKRVKITSRSKFLRLIFYIHANPQLHNLSSNYKDYQWSSYQDYVNQNFNRIQGVQVIKTFNGLQNFNEFHSQPLSVLQR